MGDLELILNELVGKLSAGSVYFNFAANGLGVVVYILQALALYTIADRRGLGKPWLAWIPVVNVWILGSVSDQYQYVVKRQVKNKRKVLLGLSIVTAAILVFLVAFIFVGLFAGFLAMEPSIDAGEVPVDTEKAIGMIIALLVVILLALAWLVLAIVHTVYFYTALYDVFCSCDPNNSTLYIVLSIVGNFMVEGVYSVFLLLCKDKDLGMPPRKSEVVTPGEIPANTEE